MKKIVALVLCLVMVVGVMTGCQKKMDAETLYQKMTEATKAVTAQSMDGELELALKFAGMGMTMELAMGLELGMELKADLSAMHMDVVMALEAMGQNEQTDMEIYASVEGDDLVSYFYNGGTDTWVKSTESGFQDLLTQYQDMAKEFQSGNLPKGALTLAEEQVTVGERKCYVLNQQVDGATMQSFMSQYMDEMLAEAMETEEIDAESQEILDMIREMDWSKLSYTVVYHVDAETFLTREVSVEIQGLGDVFCDIAGVFMAALLGDMGDMTVEVPTCKLNMKNMAYNDEVTVPSVPQEAIDNAVEMAPEDDFYEEELELTNPPQEDGSYLMLLGDYAVRIQVPENFEVYMSEADYLATMTAEMEEMVDYMVVEGMTAAEMQESYDLQVETSKDEERWLSDKMYEGANGFTVTELIYNDGVYEVTAWLEVPDGLVIVCNTSFEYLPEVEAILTAIEIGQ